MTDLQDGLRLERLGPSTESDYSDLVAHAPGSSFTHTLFWRDALAAAGMGEAVYWLASRGAHLRAALPAFVQHGEWGAVLNSLPFVQSTGGVVCRSDVGPQERAELVAALTQAMLAWSGEHGVSIACMIGSAFAGQDDQVAFASQPDFCLRRRIRAIDLSQSLEFHPSVRNHVRKAQGFNLQMRQAGTLEDAKRVHEIYAENRRKLGVEPQSWSFSQGLFERCGGQGPARFLLAEVEGEAVASMLLMRHGDTVHYYAAATTERGRSVQANSWMCDLEIRAAKESGLQWWNWMVAPTSQVYEFEKHWGGEDRTYSIWGWCLQDVSSWKLLSPSDLSKRFPGYFVLPYDWLSPHKC